ncbi:MAG: AsnC family transcriptional regulator [Deltaproteobacteria bacterium]|nr:AsnC family transcriptional regulator [Deltaproteobacteria bacterium]
MNKTQIDEIDRTILNRIQSDFPITSRPYAAIAEELGFREKIVIDHISRLRKLGIIRRIGGNFGPEKLGFVSTLCAASVPEEKIDSFAAIVNSYPGVTHNYTRDNTFNVWFTFIASSMVEIKANIKEISQKTGVHDILNLPATHVFKIKAHFDL